MSFVIITKIYRTVVTLPSSSSCNKEKKQLTNVAWCAENWETYTFLLENPEELDHLVHKGRDGMIILVLILEAETQCEDVNWIQMDHDMITKECFSEQSKWWTWMLQKSTELLSSCMMGCWLVLSPTRKETNYSDQTQDLFNTLSMKLNTFLSPLL